MSRLSTVALFSCCLLPFSVSMAQQPSKPKADGVAALRYVVYISRHGVRSPTGKAATYNQYSAGRWPEWPVQPGYLTPHGFHLMELFGDYDRAELANEGLLPVEGCADAGRVTIYADSDERTRETGKALAKGLMPGCEVPVAGLPEGTNDPLFHPLPEMKNMDASARAKAAIEGRIGGDPANLTLAYHEPIAMLDHILATCGGGAGTGQRTSLLEIPPTLAEGTGDHLVEMKGPLNTASTLSENLLLEYTEGMDAANVGWGCVRAPEIRTLMSLHTAATDFSQRTQEVARAQAARLLEQVRLSIHQAVQHRAVAGALGKPADRALILVGHDTNLENIAGALSLTWIVDGRRDDTPPGSALVFELWQAGATGEYSVRTYFTAQTLEQMRESTALTLANPPARAEVFLPGCSRADMSCALGPFLQLLDFRSDKRPVAKR